MTVLQLMFDHFGKTIVLVLLTGLAVCIARARL